MNSRGMETEGHLAREQKRKGNDVGEQYSGSIAHVCIYQLSVFSGDTHVRLTKATFLFQGPCGRHLRRVQDVCLC